MDQLANELICHRRRQPLALRKSRDVLQETKFLFLCAIYFLSCCTRLPHLGGLPHPLVVPLLHVNRPKKSEKVSVAIVAAEQKRERLGSGCDPSFYSPPLPSESYGVIWGTKLVSSVRAVESFVRVVESYFCESSHFLSSKPPSSCCRMNFLIHVLSLWRVSCRFLLKIRVASHFVALKHNSCRNGQW